MDWTRAVNWREASNDAEGREFLRVQGSVLDWKRSQMTRDIPKDPGLDRLGTVAGKARHLTVLELRHRAIDVGIDLACLFTRTVYTVDPRLWANVDV